MLSRRRLGEQDESRHPWLEDDRRSPIEFYDNSLTNPPDAADRRADRAPLKLRRPGSIVIGLRRQRTRSTPVIRLPTIGAMPRRMVSTSGNSGMVSAKGWLSRD